MRYAVLLVQEAEDDLVGIWRYIALSDSVERADGVLARLEGVCRRLDRFPNRGRVLPELMRLGVLDFRETLLGPYRIAYEVIGHEVHVHAVLDGRRDLQDLLVERLLRS